MTDLSKPPTTTEQEDITTAGQRRINLIWEVTQSTLAILVAVANMIVCVARAIGHSSGEYPVVLASAFFLIMGAYFQRTNHQIIGGIGPKATDNQRYEGR